MFVGGDYQHLISLRVTTSTCSLKTNIHLRRSGTFRAHL